MRLAIMQPYFLPYIGYFQLMAAVDKFVLLDDVNFINRGWINRNRIAVNGEPYWLTLPLAKASQNRLINEIDIIDDPEWRRKTMRTVELAYNDAPFAGSVLPFFQKLLSDATGSLPKFLFGQLRQIADYVGIRTEMEPTSAIYPKQGRTGQDRILDICAREGATSYLNLPGGRSLYDTESFAATGIELLFLDPNLPALTLQHSGAQGPVLSILDILMLNSAGAIREATQAAGLEPAQ
ncbi:MAG: hypothetical protein QOJ45_1311 [Verrucomicrobiota bacterium]|jgi:hypothetical protein